MKRHLIIIVVSIAFVWGCASQQDVIYLDNRLSQLEVKSAKMEKILNTSTKAKNQQELELRSQSASLHVEVDTLKEEIRNLGGRIEEIEYQLNQGAGGFEKNIGQIQEMVTHQNERLGRVEKYLNLESMERKTAGSLPFIDKTLEKQPAVPPETTKDLPDIDLYMVAKKAFDNADYESAKKGFEELLRKYPKSQRADNAQFWLGESYYQEKWYEKAILEYQKVIEKYPKGNKVAAALLKQGFSFLNLGDKNNARLIFRELINKYPSSNEAAVAKKKLSEI